MRPAVMTLATLLCIAGHAGCRAAPPRVHIVTVESMRFRPEVLDITAGDTVRWVNEDLVAHTATASDGRFDSKVIAAGESWTYTARTPGRVAYVCALHPTMTATVHVR